MLLFGWSETNWSIFILFCLFFFRGRDAEAAEEHWEGWECQDKDDQWGRNAGVLLS